MRVRDEPIAWILAVLTIFALVSVCRIFGLADGVLLGATPASGAALGAAVLLRGPGALAAALAFVAAGLAWDLSPGAALLDGATHGLAAAGGATVMRTLARRRAAKSRTSDWLIFLAGVAAFTVVVAAGRLLGVPRGWTPGASGPLDAVLLSAIFEPLGVFTFSAALFSLGEFPRIIAEPRPALAIAALAAVLLGFLSLLLSLPLADISPSGGTLMLAIPLCLWIAMQRRSLDGAAISLLAANVALAMLVAEAGSIGAAEFVTAALYLQFLVATCQLVHAVNLDRLAALAQLEAHTRELETRVAERTARFAAMAEKALAADAAKSQFIATVSHEIRTPLNGVLGMASVVLAADLDPETRTNVEIIRSSGFHLLDVINRILDFSQIDQGRPIDAAIEFDLTALIEEVLAEARFLPYAADLDLGVEVAPGLVTQRRGDRHGLRQILTNLVGNAAKFTNAGSVTVRCREAAGFLRIEVRDTGIGVRAEDVDRIFLPFEQSEWPSARRSGGTGLGLAICAEVVKRMAGRIGVDSAPGEGATFWIEIPLPAVIARADAGDATAHR